MSRRVLTDQYAPHDNVDPKRLGVISRSAGGCLSLRLNAGAGHGFVGEDRAMAAALRLHWFKEYLL